MKVYNHMTEFDDDELTTLSKLYDIAYKVNPFFCDGIDRLTTSHVHPNHQLFNLVSFTICTPADELPDEAFEPKTFALMMSLYINLICMSSVSEFGYLSDGEAIGISDELTAGMGQQYQELLDKYARLNWLSE